MVMKLLDDGSKITWTPRKDEGLYAFAGRAKLNRLLSGLVVTQGMAFPPGFVDTYCELPLSGSTEHAA